MKNKILVVDDEVNMLALLSMILEKDGYQVETALNGEEALGYIEGGGIDLVLSDLVMFKMDGLALLRKCKEVSPSTPFIIITGYGTISSAVEVVKSGAYDYITKPFDNEELRSAVKKALEYHGLTRKLDLLEDQDEGLFGNINIIGRHEKMRELFRLIKVIAESDATILIYGESGVGKEVVARAIHNISHRKENSFLPIDCGSIPETLLESELFGHIKGAFTDAFTTKIGLFEEAHGGTLFLDEIATTSPLFQSKLLRVLQEGEIRPVGGNKITKVDVRIIAASNRDLRAAVREKAFREDLYYRLSVIPLYIPPLRERREDIPLLVDYFIKKYQEKEAKEKGIRKYLSPRTLRLLMDYPWPGNVRELENVIEKGVVLSHGPELKIDSVFLEGGKPIDEKISLKQKVREVVVTAEKEQIIDALLRAKMNHKLAAKILGISRASLYNKIKEYDIKVKPTTNK